MSIGFKARVAGVLAAVMGAPAVNGSTDMAPRVGSGYPRDMWGMSGQCARMVRKNRRLARHGRRL